MTSQSEDSADHILYRTYYALMMADILHHLGFDATARNKATLHAFHKKMLGYKTISGATHEELSVFLFAVGVFWAERGIFVRSSGRQPWGIENMPLNGSYEGKKIWDLL